MRSFFLKGGGSLDDIWIIGGTVLEVLAPVSPCHSLVQHFIGISFLLPLNSNHVQYNVYSIYVDAFSTLYAYKFQ